MARVGTSGQHVAHASTDRTQRTADRVATARWLPDISAGGLLSNAGEVVSANVAEQRAPLARAYRVSANHRKLSLQIFKRLENGDRELATEHQLLTAEQTGSMAIQLRAARANDGSVLIRCGGGVCSRSLILINVPVSRAGHRTDPERHLTSAFLCK